MSDCQEIIKIMEKMVYANVDAFATFAFEFLNEYGNIVKSAYAIHDSSKELVDKVLENCGNAAAQIVTRDDNE